MHSSQQSHWQRIGPWTSPARETSARGRRLRESTQLLERKPRCRTRTGARAGSARSVVGGREAPRGAREPLLIVCVSMHARVAVVVSAVRSLSDPFQTVGAARGICEPWRSQKSSEMISPTRAQFCGPIWLRFILAQRTARASGLAHARIVVGRLAAAARQGAHGADSQQRCGVDAHAV